MENNKLEALFNENSTQTLKEQLRVDESVVSCHLKTMGKI